MERLRRREKRLAHCHAPRSVLSLYPPLCGGGALVQRIAGTLCRVRRGISADEMTDLGYESGTPVSPDYTTGGSKFTGKINWVQSDVGNDDNDHFIDPKERLRMTMARQ